MSEKLDSLLSSSRHSGGAAPSLDALRRALATEKRLPTARQSTLRFAWLCLGMIALTAMVLLATGATEPHLLLQRAPLLALLWGSGALSTLAALRPHSTPRVALALLAVTAATVLCVVERGEGFPSASPGWVCSVSHFAIDLVPLIAVISFLRNAAFGATRAVLAGAAAGTVGLALGELACAQSARHVALFHLPVWLLIAGLAVVLSKLMKPRSYAP